jgi:hypothetical protein
VAERWQESGRRGRRVAGGVGLSGWQVDSRSGNKAAGRRQKWQKSGRRVQDVGGRETQESRRQGGGRREEGQTK